MANNFGVIYNCLGFFGFLILDILFSLSVAGSFVVRSISIELKNDTIFDIMFAYMVLSLILLSSVLPFTFYFLIYVIRDISYIIYDSVVEKVADEIREGHVQLDDVETE